MNTKKIKELNWHDLGKRVELLEENGDRSSGTLGSVMLYESLIQLHIGNANVTVENHDGEISFLEEN